MYKNRISIHISTRDRHSEIALLLQSLRCQTYQNFDIVIIDESQTPIMNNYFLQCLIARIKYEKHYVIIIPNQIRLGVCNSRNLAIQNDYFNNGYVCRLDDDVIIEPNYLKKLVLGIDKYDIMSGVTPSLNNHPVEKSIKNMKIINKKIFDKKGNIIKYNDDCGMLITESGIYPAHEFRSCALIKKEVIDKIHYENNLSPVGFREEAFFSFRALAMGFKIGVNTKAIAWHLQTPSGGCRFPDYSQKVSSDHSYFMKWAKELYLKNKVFRNAIKKRY